MLLTMNDNDKKIMTGIGIGMGAAQELLTRGGWKNLHPHRAGKIGAAAVSGLAVVAPGAVAAAVPVAVALAPIAIGAGVAFTGYRLYRWLKD